jgi:RNA polymerase sigma-70 factor (ECF subfamily)
MAQLATRNREDALEIVQEAMFGLVRCYAKRPPETWPPLFHRILQNRIRDWHRRNILREKLMCWFGKNADEQNTIEAIPDPHNKDPFHQLGLSDAGNSLIEALQRLPLRQQQVFMLRVWEGLDVQATAQVMGCSAGSVKTHFSRARQKLKAAMEDYWP